MYELLIKLIYQADYEKYTIQELSEMKAILNRYNKEVLEVKLKRVKEQGNDGEIRKNNQSLRH